MSISNQAAPNFRPAAVEPVQCLKTGWDLIRSQYWLFLGMALLGMVIGSAAPFGILMGPMMCGIYLAIFTKRRGQPVNFGVLFKGFEYFGQSVIATLIHSLPIFVVVVPAYLFFYVSVAIATATQGRNQNSGIGLGIFVVFGLVFLIIVVFILLLSLMFIFSYPLIVDRQMTGVDSVKLSFKAALANFWPLLGLLFLNWLTGVLGLCLCIVGLYLVLPVTFAATGIAYEQVFGLNNSTGNSPPPPPVFST